MPAYIADLHNHTPLTPTDYRGDPATTAGDIVAHALESGINVYAVTDHCTWDFVPEILEAADQAQEETGRELLVVPGVELKVSHGDDEVHVVALFDRTAYRTALESLFDVLAIPKSSLSLAELPRFTLEHDPVLVCRAVDSLGGLCVIAHADRYFGDYRLIDSPLFEELVAEDSVVAVDVLDRDNVSLFVKYNDVSVIGCSDSHALSEMGRRHALLAMPSLDFEGLRRSLERRAAVHVGVA